MLILAVLVPGMVPALVGRVCRHLYAVAVVVDANGPDQCGGER